MITQRQELFALYLFEGMTQRDAWIKAGYSSNYDVALIDTHACALANSDKIKTRLAELRKPAEDKSVMNILERKQRLTEIGRARLPDYVTESGIKIDTDSPNTAALAGIQTKVVYHKKGREPEIVTDIKLHDPTKAIDLLNKMDKIYSETAQNPSDVINNFVFILPDGTRVMPRQLAPGNTT